MRAAWGRKAQKKRPEAEGKEEEAGRGRGGGGGVLRRILLRGGSFKPLKSPDCYDKIMPRGLWRLGVSGGVGRIPVRILLASLLARCWR